MLALSNYAVAHSPVLTIAREGLPFTKPADYGTFLEAILIPATTNTVTVSGVRQRFLGTFQINVWVKDNAGPGEAETIAGELAALFTVVPKTLLPVSVETPLTAHRAILDGSGYRILPCDFSYRMEV